jgi:hypothetical protein
MKFFSEHPDLDHMEKARMILMQSGWNYDHAVQQYKQSKAFKINFMIVGGLPYPNNNPSERLVVEFNPEDEALIIVEKLKMLRPLPDSANPQAQVFYKVYRD